MTNNKLSANWSASLRKTECLKCGDRRILHVHHIWTKSNIRENLIPLCPTCHSLVHLLGYDYELIGRIIGMMHLLSCDLNKVMDNIEKSHSDIIKENTNDIIKKFNQKKGSLRGSQ